MKDFDFDDTSPVVSKKTKKKAHAKTASKYHPSDSRFFFKLSPSTEEQVSRLENSTKKKTLEHVDDELEAEAKKYLPQVMPELETRIKEVRDFFLTEVAPRTLAAQAGVEQALEIIKRSVKTEVEKASFVQFEQMLRQASKQKMAEFVVQYMGIKASPESLVQGLQPTRTTVPIIDALQQFYSQPGEGPAGHVPERKPRHIRNKEAAEIARKAALLAEGNK